MSAEEVFLGRQPILNRDGELVAYELLFRSGHANVSNVTDDLQATASVIHFAFGQLGARAVLGPHLGFVNVSAAMLHSDLIDLLPRKQIVLELLETVVVTEALVARCRELKHRGFGIALDDFVFTEAHVPLLDLADVVKIDLLLHEHDVLEDIVLQLKAWPVKLLAEKVDSEEQARYCAALGFDLFQGFYFALPAVLSARRPAPATLPLLTLLERVLDHADIRDIELAVHRLPGLHDRALRLLNSAACGAGASIASLPEAAAALGKERLRRWLQLLPFMTTHDSPGPNPLLQLAAGRARLMQMLAARHPHAFDLADAAYTTGLLSLADALLEMTLDHIVERLELTDAVRAALLRREGELGRLLSLAESVERADPDSVARFAQQSPSIGLQELTRAQLEAMAWVNELAEPAG